MKAAFFLAALVGTLSFAAMRPAQACGMRWEPEPPATEAILAEAAEYEKAEEPYAALRLYERAMNDHRAEAGLRARAALHAARLRTVSGDVPVANAYYGRAALLAAQAAVHAIQGDPAPVDGIGSLMGH